MKTQQPIILTARLAEVDLERFDTLRQAHFPAGRNYLRAHLTMFHRLPGEYLDRILNHMSAVAEGGHPIQAQVSGVRHLGAGVAFAIDCVELADLRARLSQRFRSWLGPQDLQTWRPHITVQNKVEKAAADDLCRLLSQGFKPWSIAVEGMDAWTYLGGPWRHERTVPFPA